MLGITCEGGAARTVYSCGVLDRLLKEDIMCDQFTGVSAGIAFGVSYLSRQYRRNLHIAAEHMPTSRYMGWHHLLRPSNRSYYNLDFAFSELPEKYLPFDYKAFAEYKGIARAVVTNVETGEAEYLDCPRDDHEQMLLRASCAMPLMFPIMEIGGKKYLDGGVADSIPFMHTIDCGCDRNIVILSHQRGYVRKDEPVMKAVEWYYKDYPGFVRSMKTRAERYNESMAQLEKLRKSGRVFVFSPKHTFGVGRLEKDPRKLVRLYHYGYEHAEHEMKKLKEYLS